MEDRLILRGSRRSFFRVGLSIFSPERFRIGDLFSVAWRNAVGDSLLDGLEGLGGVISNVSHFGEREDILRRV